MLWEMELVSVVDVRTMAAVIIKHEGFCRTKRFLSPVLHKASFVWYRRITFEKLYAITNC